MALASALRPPGVGAICALCSLRYDPIYTGRGLPRGSGKPVMLVGGFGAPRLVLQPLSWVRIPPPPL
jgi:hypothetical protein